MSQNATGTMPPNATGTAKGTVADISDDLRSSPQVKENK